MTGYYAIFRDQNYSNLFTANVKYPIESVNSITFYIRDNQCVFRLCLFILIIQNINKSIFITLN